DATTADAPTDAAGTPSTPGTPADGTETTADTATTDPRQPTGHNPTTRPTSRGTRLRPGHWRDLATIATTFVDVDGATHRPRRQGLAVRAEGGRQENFALLGREFELLLPRGGIAQGGIAHQVGCHQEFAVG